MQIQRTEIETVRTVMFTEQELWLLQAVVRHEAPGGWNGRWPAVSVELNDQIAEALDFCDRYQVAERPLKLSRGDLLLIDFCVPQSAKSPAGQPLGRQILLKSFRARQPDFGPDAEEPDHQQRLEEWRDAITNGKPDHDAHGDALAG